MVDIHYRSKTFLNFNQVAKGELGKRFIYRFDDCKTSDGGSNNCIYRDTSINFTAGVDPAGVGNSDWGGGVGRYDLSDTTRGYGYISYSMQVPTTGVTNGQQVGTTSKLKVGADETRVSGVQASLTITNVQSPNISFTKLYSVDNGTTWSPNVTANPGQSVLVRLWSENTGGASVTNGNIKDTLPATFTYVPGSTRNCINPSTATVTSPDNSELVCDTGTPTQKDSLFTALTNTATTGGVSPSAGLYDAAGGTVALGGTAFNAPAGVKEIGKKRYASYLSTEGCGTSYRWDGVYAFGNSVTPIPRIGNPTIFYPASNYTCGTSNNITIDTLDPIRSKSFIEYSMLIPTGTAAGNYGTVSTLASTATTPEFTAVTSGANGTGITVSGDPAFSIKKLLALPTSGTGTSAICPTSTSAYSATLSNTVPGATVCVRLAYQNKTSGAVSNAAITDTLSSGLTYINNSTSNCLTPAIGSELCANNASQANTAWTGNNGWTGSNFALAPHAGLYGQSATGATSVMEMGKKTNIHLSQCTPAGYQDYYLRQVDVTNSSTQTVASCGSGFVNTGISPNPKSATTTGARYLHLTLSDPQAQPNPRQDYFVQTVTANNSATLTATCPSGYQSTGVSPNPKSADTFSNRYLSFLSCTQNTYQDYFIQSVTASNSSTSSATCPSGYTATGLGNNPEFVDLLDPANGTGYIQYKISTPTNPTSQSLTLPNASLSGTGQTTSTSNAIINFSAIPLTVADIPGLTVVCDSAPVNSLTSCRFILPTNKTLPTNFNLKIGDTDNAGPTPALAQTCSITNTTTSEVTCTSVPTGNSVGNMPIYARFEFSPTATKTPTGETVTITGINFGNISWVFNPDQGSTSPLFRSNDNTSITVNNFKTIFDPTPSSNTRYTCTLEYRAYNDRLITTPTWTAINTTPIAYTTGTGTTQGCTFNLTKQQRANALNHSLRLTITDTTITTPSATNPNTYTFYNEYIYRFQGAGTASGM